MNGFIGVDASVALKWVLEEEHSDRAFALLTDATRQGSRIIGPPHLLVEVTNALYQRVRRGELPLLRARQLVDILLEVGIEVRTPAGLYRRSLELAAAYGLPTAYDALYVALCELAGCELWTADRRLLQALGGHLGWVRSIAAYEPA